MNSFWRDFLTVLDVCDNMLIRDQTDSLDLIPQCSNSSESCVWCVKKFIFSLCLWRRLGSGWERKSKAVRDPQGHLSGCLPSHFQHSWGSEEQEGVFERTFLPKALPQDCCLEALGSAQPGWEFSQVQGISNTIFILSWLGHPHQSNTQLLFLCCAMALCSYSKCSPPEFLAVISHNGNVNGEKNCISKKNAAGRKFISSLQCRSVRK